MVFPDLRGPVDDGLKTGAKSKSVGDSSDDGSKVHQHRHAVEATKALVEHLHLIRLGPLSPPILTISLDCELSGVIIPQVKAGVVHLLPWPLRSLIIFMVAGIKTPRFKIPVANAIPSGKSESHRLEASNRPLTPDGTPRSGLPGKVKARTTGRAA